MPFNGESYGSIAEHAEIVAVVRVLGDPFARKNQILSESLFEAGMEFIAKAGTQRSARPGRTQKKRR